MLGQSSACQQPTMQPAAHQYPFIARLETRKTSRTQIWQRHTDHLQLILPRILPKPSKCPGNAALKHAAYGKPFSIISGFLRRSPATALRVMRQASQAMLMYVLGAKPAIKALDKLPTGPMS